MADRTAARERPTARLRPSGFAAAAEVPTPVKKSKEEEFIVQKLFHGLTAIVAVALVAGLVASVAAARLSG